MAESAGGMPQKKQSLQHSAASDDMGTAWYGEKWNTAASTRF
jgi:hypothetical protein